MYYRTKASRLIPTYVVGKSRAKSDRQKGVFASLGLAPDSTIFLKITKVKIPILQIIDVIIPLSQIRFQ